MINGDMQDLQLIEQVTGEAKRRLTRLPRDSKHIRGDQVGGAEDGNEKFADKPCPILAQRCDSLQRLGEAIPQPM